MASQNKKSLSAVVATGPGAAVDTLGTEVVSMHVIASAVTTGGTVKLQGSSDNTNWSDLATRTVSANGTTTDTVTVAVKWIRANVTARTDGTYTVWLTTGGYGQANWNTD